LSPPDSSVFAQGERIQFSVAGRNAYNNQPAGTHFLWLSNISGLLSYEAVFSLDSLPKGIHLITAVVEDSRYGQGSAAIVLTVADITEPRARITTPASDTTFYAGGSFKPAGTEYIPSDGAYVAGHVWSFGQGSGIPETTASDPGTITWNNSGTFELIFKVLDTYGRAGADTVRIVVLNAEDLPIVTIVSPAAVDTTIPLGDSLFLEAEEEEKTVPIISRAWIYPEGSGLEGLADSTAAPGWRKFDRMGTFIVLYQAMDEVGVVLTDSFTVTVGEPRAIEAGIVSPGCDTTVTVGSSIRFEAEVKGDTVAVRNMLWDFTAESGISPRAYSSIAPGWRRFDQTGTFEIIFTIQDTLDRTTADSVTINVIPDEPLEVRITSPGRADTIITEGDSINFAGEISPADIKLDTIYWNYGPGSGLESLIDSTATPGWRTFDPVYTFTVRFGVKDISGRAAEATVTVDVRQNQPPTASISRPSADSVIISQGATVDFRATDNDPEGRMKSRLWTWGQGSGVASAPGDLTAEPGNKAFPNSGAFWVMYAATDHKDVQALDSVKVVVLVNALPIANITSMSDTTIYEGGSVPLEGAVTDTDGSVVSTGWSYRLEGSETVNEISPGIPSLQLDVAGAYQVYFTVTDNKGASASDTVRVVVQVSPPNDPPTAEIIRPVGTQRIVGWDTLSFAAKDSDPDGVIVKRQWSFGSGSSIPNSGDTLATTGPKVFTAAMDHWVEYTVTDNLGATTTDRILVIVSLNWRPIATITAPKQESLSITQGSFITFQAYDDDPDGQIVYRRWTFGAGSGIPNHDTAIPGNRSFFETGDFWVVYTVKDNNDISRSDSVFISVTSP
ncbi:MAG: hypothetical protein U9P14_03875, partial [Gemmatimonadota bacterium]|nr:hypothetical protein [Gemmatimonadota bacterium]